MVLLPEVLKLKPGDRVKFLEWNDQLHRLSRFDPNAKPGTGTIEEVLFHYAGYALLIRSDDGRTLDLHETIHHVEVIEI